MNVYKKTGYATDYYTTYFLTDEGRDTMYLHPASKLPVMINLKEER
jgi:hypothetical protein